MRQPCVALVCASAWFSSLSFSFPASAAPAAGSPPPVSIPAPPLGGMLQVLLGLAVVLGAIWATAWLLRRFSPGHGGGTGVLRVVGGVMVGPKERVVVVESGDTWLLIGVAPGQVNMLHSMAKPEGVETAAVAEFQGKNFGAWLRQAVKGNHGG